MADGLKEFTAQLGGRGHLSLLERRSGTVLVELEDDGKTERWYVNVKRGDLSLMPALLLGLLSIEGDVPVIVALQGLFRPSAGAAGEAVAGYAGRRR